MGKLSGTIYFLAAGAGASAGGFYLSKMFSFDSTLPETLEEFEKGDVLEGCVRGLFPGLKDMKTSKNAASPKKEEEIKKNFLGNHKHKVDGCLVVNWNRESFKDK